MVREKGNRTGPCGAIEPCPGLLEDILALLDIEMELIILSRKIKRRSRMYRVSGINVFFKYMILFFIITRLTSLNTKTLYIFNSINLFFLKIIIYFPAICMLVRLFMRYSLLKKLIEIVSNNT